MQPVKISTDFTVRRLAVKEEGTKWTRREKVFQKHPFFSQPAVGSGALLAQRHEDKHTAPRKQMAETQSLPSLLTTPLSTTHPSSNPKETVMSPIAGEVQATAGEGKATQRAAACLPH